MNEDNQSDKSKPSHYPTVGRHEDINLKKYTVVVHGREIIDYEKLKRDEPELYQKVIKIEHDIDQTEPLEDQ